MKTLLIIDSDYTRRNWLKSSLEDAGLLVLNVHDSLDSALNTIATSNPDIVLIAPKVNGVSGTSITRTIMEKKPVPIVLLTDPKDNLASRDAKWCGATSTAPVPVNPGEPEHEEQVRDLARKLELMSEIPVVRRLSLGSSKPTHLRQRLAEQKLVRMQLANAEIQPRDARTHLKQVIPKLVTAHIDPDSDRSHPVKLDINMPPALIGIATSTGGPVTIKDVLRYIPASYPIPIVVIQHLTEGFSSVLAKDLDNSLQLKVVEAKNGELLRPGYVYVVAQQKHAVLGSGLRINLLPRDKFPGHCPSGTAFLTSMATMLGRLALGVVLTGMGDDGSVGLLAIRNKGGLTYAQEESTCTMPSMPHEAIAIGAASYVLSPEAIGAQLSKFCLGSRRY